MFRFFRSIRQGLLAENKTLKYLKYAVGEFVLVVLGILTALYINDWNEGRKLEQQRLELIENLKEDFQTNLKNLEETLFDVENNINNFDGFLADIFDEKKSLTIEDMQQGSTNAFSAFVFRSFLGAYSTAVSSGSITLIKDSSLNELFRDYEERNRRFEFYNDMGREEFFQGGVVEIRKKVGSLAGFQPAVVTPRQELTYSAVEYRDFFRQKDVYAVYENQFLLKKQRWTFLTDLKTIHEQILAALEALD